MPLRQVIFMLLFCVIIFLSILELVRQGKLREEYSWFWLLSSAAFFIFILRYDWLVALTGFIGAGNPTSTLFLGAFLFLLAVNIHFSIKVSQLTTEIKNLAQENSLLKYRLEAQSQAEKGEIAD